MFNSNTQIPYSPDVFSSSFTPESVGKEDYFLSYWVPLGLNFRGKLADLNFRIQVNLLATLGATTSEAI